MSLAERILMGLLVVAVVSILIVDTIKMKTGHELKYKFAIEWPQGKAYSAEIPVFIGGCIRFNDEDGKARIICGDSEIREL